MSALEHHYLPFRSRLRTAGRAAEWSREASASYRAGLKHSSPWPWVLALAVSSTIWAGIGWLVWKFV